MKPNTLESEVAISSPEPKTVTVPVVSMPRVAIPDGQRGKPGGGFRHSHPFALSPTPGECYLFPDMQTQLTTPVFRPAKGRPVRIARSGGRSATALLPLPDTAPGIPQHLGDEPRFEGWTEPQGIAYSFAKPGGYLFQGDSLRWLRSLPDGCVDMVFADPPYGIGKAAWDVFSDEDSYLDWCDRWVAEVARVLSPTGTCYICGFSEILADVKFIVRRHFKACRWLVWHYRNKANLGSDWGRSHESILHFRKAASTALNVDDIRIPYGAHTLKYPARTQAETSAFAKSAPQKNGAWTPNPLGAKPKDVFDIPTTCNGMGEKTPHPTQKPEELLRKLVLASSNPGDWVLDPFSGSGTTLVAAEQLGRRWLGCDLSAEYNDWAAQRLRAVPARPVADWIALDRETSARRDSIR